MSSKKDNLARNCVVNAPLLFRAFHAPCVGVRRAAPLYTLLFLTASLERFSAGCYLSKSGSNLNLIYYIGLMVCGIVMIMKRKWKWERRGAKQQHEITYGLGEGLVAWKGGRVKQHGACDRVTHAPILSYILPRIRGF